MEDSNRVEVVLNDGTVKRGDMVLGCDGVHSLIRQRIWDPANQKIPRPIMVQEKTSIITRWKCLVAMGLVAAKLVEQDMTVVHDDGYSFLFLTQPEKLFFVFFQLEHEFRWPERSQYTNADAEAVVPLLAIQSVRRSCLGGLFHKGRRLYLTPS